MYGKVVFGLDCPTGMEEEELVGLEQALDSVSRAKCGATIVVADSLLGGIVGNTMTVKVNRVGKFHANILVIKDKSGNENSIAMHEVRSVLVLAHASGA